MSAGQTDTTGQSSKVFGILIVGINLVICAWPFLLFFMSGKLAEKWEVISTKCRSIFNLRNPSASEFESESMSHIKEDDSKCKESEQTRACMNQASVVDFHSDQRPTHAENIGCNITVTENLQCPLQLNLSYQQLQSQECLQDEIQPEILGRSGSNLHPTELVMLGQISCSSTPQSSAAMGQFVWFSE
jgi:hypothetical protein